MYRVDFQVDVSTIFDHLVNILVGRRDLVLTPELRIKINIRMEEAAGILKELGYQVEHVSPREFYDYMTGETPTGDVTTLEDVLGNEFLMVHELVEISELKKKGIPIDKRTVMRFYPKVYEAHFVAIDYELSHALSRGKYGWIERRLAQAKEQLDDPHLPEEFSYLKQEAGLRWRSLAKKFAKYARLEFNSLR